MHIRGDNVTFFEFANIIHFSLYIHKIATYDVITRLSFRFYGYTIKIPLNISQTIRDSDLGIRQIDRF